MRNAMIIGKLINIHFQQFLLHREFWFKFFLNAILPTLIPLLIWESLYAQSESTIMNGWTHIKMQHYYLFVLLISSISQVEIHYLMSDLIQEGVLNNWLVRPIKEFEFLVSYALARLIGLTIPATFLIFILATKIIGVPFEFFIGFKILLIGNSILIQILISILVGLFAFWTIKTEGIFAGIFIASNFLGGGILPILFLPNMLQYLSNLLPFQYAIYKPIILIINNSNNSEYFPLIIRQFFWIFTLFFIAKILWKLGLKKYDAVGG